VKLRKLQKPASSLWSVDEILQYLYKVTNQPVVKLKVRYGDIVDIRDDTGTGKDGNVKSKFYKILCNQ
jgi:hypothetical protein